MNEIKSGRVSMDLDFKLPEGVKFRPVGMRNRACLAYSKGTHSFYIEVPIPSMINHEFAHGFVDACNKDDAHYKNLPIYCSCKECNPNKSRYIIAS